MQSFSIVCLRVHIYSFVNRPSTHHRIKRLKPVYRMEGCRFKPYIALRNLLLMVLKTSKLVILDISRIFGRTVFEAPPRIEQILFLHHTCFMYNTFCLRLFEIKLITYFIRFIDLYQFVC